MISDARDEAGHPRAGRLPRLGASIYLFKNLQPSLVVEKEGGHSSRTMFWFEQIENLVLEVELHGCRPDVDNIQIGCSLGSSG